MFSFKLFKFWLDSYINFQVFGSLEELKEWVYDRSLKSGYVTVTQRTISKGEGSNARKTKIWIRCDRGGEHRSTAKVRVSGSKKVMCPFQLKGRLVSNGWKLEVKDSNHNHEPFQHVEGHAFARRLTPSEERLVERPYFQNMEPTNIHLAITEQNPKSVCILRDIHNTINKIKHTMYGDWTPMQVLFYYYYYH